MKNSEMSLMMNDMVAVAIAFVAVALGLLLLARGKPTVGVEMEVIRKSGTPSKLAQWIAKVTGRTEMRYVGYTHGNIRDLKLVSDGSLNSGGVEIVTPVMGGDDIGLIRRICDALRGIASADTSCGVHVHIGMLETVGDSLNSWYGDDDRYPTLAGWVGRVLAAYDHFTDPLSRMNPPSRRNNNYAEPTSRLIQNSGFGNDAWYTCPTPLHKLHTMGSSEARELLGRLASGRYYHVNIESLFKYGTLEYRQLGGTTNPNHIEKWVKLMQIITLACREPWRTGMGRDPTTNQPGSQGLFDWLGLSPDDDLRLHWERRIRRFAGTLQGDDRCTTCQRSNCDGDDYCPRQHEPVPMAYTHMTFDEEDCPRCGEESEYCECGSVSIIGMWMLMLAPIALVVGCGIGAYHTAGRAFNMKKNLRQVKSLFTGLMSRGRAASGFGWRTLSGKSPNNNKPTDYNGMWTLKKPIAAGALQDRMDEMLDAQTQVLLMHTRWPTDGANTTTNAHPHRSPQTGRITLVHNGVLWGHEHVFASIGATAETECDSEAIAACLEEGGIESVVKHCDGSMALLWTDDDEPGVLSAWHNDGNPLHFSRLDNTNGPVVWASTEEHLKKAFGKRIVKCYEATVGKHYRVKPDGTIESEFITGSYDTYYQYVRKGNYTTTSTLAVDDPKWPTHDYDEKTHEGIRPDGTRYELPGYVDPIKCQLDAIDVKDGQYDPVNPKAHNLYGSAHWEYM